MGFIDGVWVDYSLPTGVNGTMDIMQYNNEITGNLAGIALLFGIFILLFVITGKEPKVSLPVSLYVTTLIGLFMSAVSPPLIGTEILTSLIVLDVIATVILYAGGDK
jgi:hypothetical protein